MIDTFSPVLHRIDQAVRWRAVYPGEPIPPPYEILTKYSKPPEELQRKARRDLEKVVAAADVKKGKTSSRSTGRASLTRRSPPEVEGQEEKPGPSEAYVRA